MSGIDDVIARSRRGGGFAKRKTFTLARQRGIRKMREFALADPSYYILELIQAAVGNDASYINIEYNDDTLLFSYIGGRLSREEMAHLFDFLFASKDKLDVAHLRELALGINALMLFEPEQIVLESGDGTLSNTHRMVLRGVEDIIDMGRSDAPLRGTYLYATGLKRKKLESRGMSCVGERMAIESRCLTAPVLITVNNEAPFGYKRMRIPKLWGYHPTVSFDEGDLYGVVGLSGWHGPTSFRLLTHGVWIQTVERDLVSGAVAGGIINFDRLRKTADHSALVHDEVFEEMWIRVRPYIQQLLSQKKTPTLHDVAILGGGPIAPGELRGWLRDTGRLVAVPNRVTPRSRSYERAVAISKALAAPAVRVPRAEVASLRYIGGPEVDVVAPTLGSDEEVEYYRQPPAGPPPEPHLASPVEAATVGVGELALRVVDAITDRRSASRGEEWIRRLTEDLGSVGQVTAMLYAPERAGSAGSGVWAQVILSERLVWEGELPSSYPGQWLVVRMAHAAPSLLTEAYPPDRLPHTPLARLIAQAVLELSRDQQASLHRTALRNLLRRGGSLGEAGRTLAMQALAQRTLVRLRAPTAEADPPEVSFAWLDDGSGMLDLHVLKNLDGTEFSACDLAAAMGRTHGLVYGVIPEVAADLEGLDKRRILDLDQESERMLVSLLGEAAYVRVDRRDVLAEHRGVKCRDLALGLRDYPEFPLLVEGVDPTSWPGAEQAACIAALVQQLATCFLGLAPPQPADPRAFPDWEENRRQACRHLQYFACTAPADQRELVADLPLFLDDRGGVHPSRAVWAAVATGPCLVTYRGGLASAELGKLSAAAAKGARVGAEAPRCLTASPYLAHLLVRLGCVRVAHDFDITDEEAALNPRGPDIAYLEQVRIQDRQMVGCVGVPIATVERPAIVVLDADGRLRANMLEEARRHDVVGYVRLADGTWDEARRDDIATAIERASERLMGDLIFKLGELDIAEEARVQRVEHILLAYAARHLVLSASPNGTVVPWVARPTAQAILDLPLFSTADGYAVSAWRLVSEFCAFGLAAFNDPERETALRQALAAGLPDHLAAWIRDNLVEERVVRLAAADDRRGLSLAALPESGASASTTLRRTLTFWLERLRPDSYTGAGATHSHVDVVIGHLLFEPSNLGFSATHSRWERLNQLARPGSGGALRARGEFAIFDIDASRLYLNRHHWLVDETIENQCDPDWVAWLLLGSYAFINEVLEPVTNEHEQQFQVRVAKALAAGRLTAID